MIHLTLSIILISQLFITWLLAHTVLSCTNSRNYNWNWTVTKCFLYQWCINIFYFLKWRLVIYRIFNHNDICFSNEVPRCVPVTFKNILYTKQKDGAKFPFFIDQEIRAHNCIITESLLKLRIHFFWGY